MIHDLRASSSRFFEAFGLMPTTLSEAPGRVNLIGEHTDYNDGFVLPTAIPQKTRIEIAPRSDNQVHVLSLDMSADGGRHHYELGCERPQHCWSDYFEGVTWLLHRKGYRIGGFNLLVSSDIPIGAGLSSSAALLVALFRALREQFELGLNDREIALLSQDVENNFVGANVGIMDQMASSLADRGTSLFLDTRSLDFERVPLPTDLIDIFVIDSGVRHNHATGGYNTRRRECEEACRILGVPSLRAISDVDALQHLHEPLLSRSRHVVTENQRVLEAVKAIRDRNMQRLGELMIESHVSMRDDYKVSVPEVDLLVDIALSHAEVCGARLTGGGFGGSVVGICKKGFDHSITSSIVARYQQQGAYHASVLVPDLSL